MKCVNCGSQNEDDAKFCLKCGKSLSREMVELICSKCGHKNKAGAVHCTECGNLLKNKTEETWEKRGSAIKRKRISPVIYFLVAIFVIIGIVLVVKMLDIKVIGILPPSDIPQQFPNKAFTMTGSGRARIHWNCDGLKNKVVPTISKNTPIQVNMGWGAYTRDQIQDFLDHAQYTVTVDGIPVRSQQYHDEIRQVDKIYTVDHGAEIEPLKPGTHFIYLKIKLSEKVFDGETYYGPGSNVESFDGICTVNVE